MCKEYIEREAVLNDIGELFTLCRETLPNEAGHHFIVEKELETHLDFVRNLPAADVVPVRHGRWNRTDAYPHRLYCSACYKTYLKNDELLERLEVPLNFCPNCGADMREES